jgi:site-specific DNA recombinase
MLEDVRAGRVDAVLVWDVDRLTRRPIEVEDWIRLHERHGVNFVTISEHIDRSTDNGRMYLRIKVAVARAEVERKGTRQMRANLQATQTAGEWVAVARSDSNRT